MWTSCAATTRRRATHFVTWARWPSSSRYWVFIPRLNHAHSSRVRLLGSKEALMNRFFAAVCLLVLASAAVRVQAQINPYKEGTPGVTGYRSEVLSEVIVQGDKFTRLAEAIPAEKYTWRPAPDARSFAEVFLHVRGR